MQPGYCITFEIVTHESAENGDVASRGFVSGSWDVEIPDGLCGPEFIAWRDEQKIDVTVNADDWINDPTDPLALERAMADVILRKGAFQTSGVPWQPGDWYSTDPDQNFETGAYRTESVHLHGWTENQEFIINRLVRSGRASV